MSAATEAGWASPSYCSDCYQNHPGHCGCPCHLSGLLSPVSFGDVLDALSAAVLFAEGGDGHRAETALLEAHLAASDAFPPGSPEAAALGILLAAAGRVAEVTA